MKCPRCGRENLAGRTECEACRAPLVDRSGETAVTDVRTTAAGTSSTPAPQTGRAAATPTEIGPGEATGSAFSPTSPSSGGSSGVSSTGELLLGTVFGGRYEIVSIL